MTSMGKLLGRSHETPRTCSSQRRGHINTKCYMSPVTVTPLERSHVLRISLAVKKPHISLCRLEMHGSVGQELQHQTENGLICDRFHTCQHR